MNEQLILLLSKLLNYDINYDEFSSLFNEIEVAEFNKTPDLLNIYHLFQTVDRTDDYFQEAYTQTEFRADVREFLKSINKDTC